MVQKFIIRTDVAFNGTTETFIKHDGTVAFTDCLSPEEYLAKSELPLRVIDENEMETLLSEFSASLQGSFVEITEKKYQTMMEVLPPRRMTSFEGGGFFFNPEALFANVHSFYCYINGKYFTADRSLYTPEMELITEIKGI